MFSKQIFFMIDRICEACLFKYDPYEYRCMHSVITYSVNVNIVKKKGKKPPKNFFNITRIDLSV